jgi:hypothetical protein
MMIVAVLNRVQSLGFVHLELDSFYVSILFVGGSGWEREHSLVDVVTEEPPGLALKRT